MKSVELFTGAGGLGIGIANVGFHHEALVEWDHDSCETIRTNSVRRSSPIVGWPEVFEGDVRQFDYNKIINSIDLVAGGPPCQPFSLGGKHKAFNDSRDMWSEAVRAVRELRPRAFIFENVRGFVRQSFATYFEYIMLQLTYPELIRSAREDWADHRARLERHHVSRKKNDLAYRVVFQVLNAADYGVPQKRHRVFIVGFREDLGIEWSFPRPTHSRDALLKEQLITGEYWERHGIRKVGSPKLEIEKLRLMNSDAINRYQPWRTVRDAISDLPTPGSKIDSEGVNNHRLNPGAKVYPGHTGSSFDEPAKTIKAGDHGVPGGENMLSLPNGKVRYFTVRESARLQSFPDSYIFMGSWTESMRQIGNAVPVLLGQTVAKSVADQIRSDAIANGKKRNPL